MPLLLINNAQGEENLEIGIYNGVVSIVTYNVYSGKTTISYCELNNEQIKEVINTLQSIIK